MMHYYRRLGRLGPVLLCTAAVGLLCLYGLGNPETSAWFPRCPIKWLTGFSCPGCGSQRAVHALLHGHVAQAWHFNAALVLALPPVSVGMWFEYVAPLRLRQRFRQATSHPVLALALTAAILCWTIGRNIW